MYLKSSKFPRKTALTLWATMIPLILIATGCGKQTPSPKLSTPSTHQVIEVPSKSDMSSFYELANVTAFNLHKHVFAEDPGNNLFLSPASVEMVLAMTENGAAGETLSAMKNTLGLTSLSNDEVNRSNKAFIDSLDKLDPTIELDIANSLWLRNDLTFSEMFLRDNTMYYNAEVRNVDFNSPAAAAEINKWVSEKTKGKITEVTPPPPGSNFTLADAIYFKGAWLYPFDKSRTTEADFNLIDGSTKEVPMMSQVCTNGYYENDQFEMVVLKYGKMNSSNNRVSMYVFLPRDVDGINDFVESLSTENWKSWTSSYSTRNVDLKLPRFTIECDKSLNNALAAMGMGVALSGNADFSKMISGSVPGGGISLGIVKQKSFVDVNEEGTEAAAVTHVAEGEGEKATPVITPMVVDHPFFFAICDDASGAILFTGTVLAP
jgi:serine protease inhibitor